MARELKIDKPLEEGVQYLLRSLLETGKVKAVFTLKKVNENGAVAYSLITNPDEIKDTLPFYPLMPANAGQLLSNFTLNSAVSEPVAVVIRPCELRAFIELVKRKKANMDNIFIISSICGGVFPLDLATNGAIEGNISNYWDAVKQYNIPHEVRPVCRACEQFTPNKHADIIVPLVGATGIDESTSKFLNSEQAETMVTGLNLEGSSITDAGELETEEIKTHRSKKTEEKKKLADGIGIEQLGIKGLVDIFGRCIGCRGCRAVCPICYCQLCNFDSQNSKYSIHENELSRKGALRVPPNTVYFHLLRLAHMGISCVACGACEDVCPANIPISSIFKLAGESIQGVFDYLPGKDVEEEIPLKMFELEELEKFED